VKEIDFHGDVDNLRYDAATHRVYVGFGEDETGAIGMVDATTNERLPEEYKLGAHPESFQLETAGPNIYVNLPDLKQIAVINRKTGAIARWPMTLEHNFPMALDEADHRLFVATHEPARLAIFDTNTGRTVAEFPCVQDADDVYYDSGRKRIYVPGGEDISACFSRRMRITTSFWQKFLRLLVREQQDILEKVTKGLTGFFSECRRAPITARRSGFIPFRTEIRPMKPPRSDSRGYFLEDSLP